MNKDEKAAVALILVYMAGTAVIVEKFRETEAKTGWLIWLVWTLFLVIYALVHDYREDRREREHERIKAVSEAKMSVLEERDRYWEVRK